MFVLLQFWNRLKCPAEFPIILSRRRAGGHAGRLWQQHQRHSSHYLLIAVVQMSSSFVFRLSSTSTTRMRCQTKDRGRWNFDDATPPSDRARGGREESTSDAAEISEGSGAGAHGRYDSIMIGQGTISGPTDRTFTVGGVATSMSDNFP